MKPETIPGSAGGKVTALRLKRQAAERYYKNPNLCVFCNSTIPLREGHRVRETRAKKFCDIQCVGLSRKKVREPKQAMLPAMPLLASTKGELLEKTKDFFSYRSTVCKNARLIMKRTKRVRVCGGCGYDKHVEVCHLKPVKDFADSATVEEINHPTNLVYLCPNCHWEMDNGFLKLRSS